MLIKNVESSSKNSNIVKYFFILTALLLSACSLKDYKHSESKVVIIKTPKLKFSDLAYIKHTGSSVALELFVAGKQVQKISIDYLICVDEGCMSKSGFNSEYLNSAYPDDILQNIILGKSIYNKQNFLKNRDGFEQSIKNESVNISYRVNSQQIYFKDKKNRIIFKIKDIYNGN